MIKDLPCTPDCPKRTIKPNCHSTCPEYLAWMQKKKKEKQDIKQYKIKNNMHEQSFTKKELQAKHKFERTKKWS